MRTALTLILILLSFSFAARGSALSGSSTANAPTQVNVTLTEFKVESLVATFKIGETYRSVLTNKGLVNHEIDSLQGAQVVGVKGSDDG